MGFLLQLFLINIQGLECSTLLNSITFKRICIYIRNVFNIMFFFFLKLSFNFITILYSKERWVDKPKEHSNNLFSLWNPSHVFLYYIIEMTLWDKSMFIHNQGTHTSLQFLNLDVFSIIRKRGVWHGQLFSFILFILKRMYKRKFKVNCN